MVTKIWVALRKKRNYFWEKIVIHAAEHLKQSPPLKPEVKTMNKQTPPMQTYLEGKGITLQSLIDSALEMYVPHPGVETEEKATEMLKEEFLDKIGRAHV